MKQRFLIILQRKKQGKPFCCCCHNNKDTRSRKDVDAGFRCCGYAPLATETGAKNTAHAQTRAQTHARKGAVNASFEVDGGGKETLGSHVTLPRERVEGNLRHTENISKNSNNQTSRHNANTSVCETCSKCLQTTCDQDLCAAQQSPCRRCKDSNVV